MGRRSGPGECLRSSGKLSATAGPSACHSRRIPSKGQADSWRSSSRVCAGENHRLKLDSEATRREPSFMCARVSSGAAASGIDEMGHGTLPKLPVLFQNFIGLETVDYLACSLHTRAHHRDTSMARNFSACSLQRATGPGSGELGLATAAGSAQTGQKSPET